MKSAHSLVQKVSACLYFSGRKSRAPFLSKYFVSQSNLPYYRRRQRFMLFGYGVLCILSIVLHATLRVPEHKAMALGLSFPGAGFLSWAEPHQSWLALTLFASALLAFCISLIIWFATGNILLPPSVWLASAWLASQPQWFGLTATASAPPGLSLVPACWFVLFASLHGFGRKGLPHTEAAPDVERGSTITQRGEISLENLQRLRLLLDRALQPVNDFNGFEWRDQFQTAAVRYQIQFMSYALSFAQYYFLPAAHAYFVEVQHRLLAKQGNPRIWHYWKWENAWGNFHLDRDPVPHENIMYSGFTGLQMALANTGKSLELRQHGDVWKTYELSEISNLLAVQYRSAPYALLACEPNWIYPLCNMITACSVRAADYRYGNTLWSGFAAKFRHGLQQEFMNCKGNFVAFRSSLTGIAPPSPGGAVMQAFPCLFLNGLFPEIASKHWQKVRSGLQQDNWKRQFWPIDVGNYGLTRASSYAASAAAAVEMGDKEMVEKLFGALDAECPGQLQQGVFFREKASLWAHTVELMARLGCKDGLRTMIERPLDLGVTSPHLERADYPHVLIAKAVCEGQCLELVLYPGTDSASTDIVVAGLIPYSAYQTSHAAARYFSADAAGRATLKIELAGRTVISVSPIQE
jgi:hypothetical protein